MIKQVMVIFLLLCGLAGNTFAGTFAIGTLPKTATYNISATKPVYGITGYILVSPVTITPSSGHGSQTYHTHSNFSNHTYETIVYYGANGDISLKAFSWAVNNNYVNYLHPAYGNGTTTLPVPPQWQHADYDVQIAASGTWTAGVLKYLTNITIGTETKKAIYFENFSFFKQYAGTTTGKWRDFIRIKNFETQSMDYKWAQAWDGTLAENHITAFNGHSGFSGSLETFNTGTPFPSAPTVSVGNYGMTFYQIGIPTLMDNTNHDLTLVDTNDNTGLTVYNAGAHAGEWLGHAP